MIIESGFGYEYTYNTPYKFQKEFKDAQKRAEINKVGLWADGVCDK
jgi:micrococcal nuclease